MPESKQIVEREHPRQHTHLPVEIWEIEKWQKISHPIHNMEYLEDVSLGGIRFKSSEHWNEGSKIKVCVQVKPLTKRFGEVVWCHKIGKCFDVGVKFISDSSIKDMKDVIDEIKWIEICNEAIIAIIEEYANEDYTM
ncbi:PilZ domain-containing protein [Candidatus Parabeggiatoa sp. HSG14]|uniref:PilZ domain-containing protein n=1 Tax=Candidatus Parabeggiatoa sp. HSG14 TaxID=3055593 RepID=UPI0025A7CD34|nr:PilZ domain-containing protein [Thiotrichales bacterium HSG14]